MFVGAGMPSILGPTPKKNVRKYPGKEGKARKLIPRGAPATRTAPEIAAMTAAHAALVTDVFMRRSIASRISSAHAVAREDRRRTPSLAQIVVPKSPLGDAVR
jgi:hypothetical protein